MRKSVVIILMAAAVCAAGHFAFADGPVPLPWRGAGSGPEAQALLTALPRQRVILTDEGSGQIWVSSYEELGVTGRLVTEEASLANRLRPQPYIQLFLNDDQALAAIHRLYDPYLQQPQDARFAVSYDNAVTIVPERDGQSLNDQAVLRDLRTRLALRGPIRVALASDWAQPEVTAAQLARLDIHQLWGQYSTTFYGGDQKRTANIWLASSKLAEVVVLPGEIFSFNDTVGPRTKENGYNEAGVIINNHRETDYGGGVCQVSTTLYNAARAAGLTIVERHSHSIPVSYVPKGRDAAVVYGEKDLRFKNDSGQAILVKSYFAYGKLTVKIFGGERSGDI